MNGKLLDEVTEERDLGVIVQSDLKCSIQCIKAVSTANMVLGMIKKTISVRDKDIILQLFKSLVRPHLACAESILFTLSQINADREENKTNWLKRMLKQYDFFLT